MANKDMENQQQINEVVTLIYQTINDQTPPKLPDAYASNPLLTELYSSLLEIRQLSDALSQGKLDAVACQSKGYMISSLKALQASFRHLTWKTQRIAEGDFLQRIDFLGDFSIAFNEMTAKLSDYSKTLNTLASFDHLTQLPNRLHIANVLTNIFAAFQKGAAPFTVVMFDIDQFKPVNDTYGHTVGDALLRQLAKAISSHFRTSDVLARYGGDEFIAILPNATADVVLHKINYVIEQIRSVSFHINDTLTLQTTLSAGLSIVYNSDSSYNDVIERADRALYASKANGRDRATLWKNNADKK